MDFLSPYAFATEQRLLAYLKREAGITDGERESAIDAGNSALGWMEYRTGRRLAARTYRAATSLGTCTLSGSTAVTGSGFSTNAKALDDVVASSGIVPGTRIVSISSDSALTLSLKTVAGITSATLTAGSEVVLVDGTGNSEIRIPEYPVLEVYSVGYLDSIGTVTALDTTGARLEKETGRYVLLADGFPKGKLNVRIEFAAGYLEPTGAARGHFSEWSTLSRVFLRAAKVFFEDERNRGGRIVSESVAQASASLPDFKMPDDIVEALAPFVRFA